MNSEAIWNLVMRIIFVLLFAIGSMSLWYINKLDNHLDTMDKRLDKIAEDVAEIKGVLRGKGLISLEER